MTLSVLPRVERLNLATLVLPDWHPEAAVDRNCSVYGYVIDHPDGAIVVDTGVGHGNDFIDELYEPTRLLLGDAVRSIGIDPTTIVGVVNSHLHFDHCGQNPMFHGSDVPIYVQQQEVEAVEADSLYTDASWALAPADQRRDLDGDEVIAEGVTILATPGHTPGHQSVVVEADEGRIVIAAQAVWNSCEFIDEQATDSNVTVDGWHAAAVDSIRRLKALRPSVVHFSHCTEYRPDTAARGQSPG